MTDNCYEMLTAVEDNNLQYVKDNLHTVKPNALGTLMSYSGSIGKLDIMRYISNDPRMTEEIKSTSILELCTFGDVHEYCEGTLCSKTKEEKFNIMLIREDAKRIGKFLDGR